MKTKRRTHARGSVSKIVQARRAYNLMEVVHSHPYQSERVIVLKALKKDLRTRIISSSNQWSKGRNAGLLECCNIIDEYRRKGGEG